MAYTCPGFVQTDLIYEPMSVSRQVPFQKALLTRMMWGAALGVENSQGPARSSSEGEASGGFLLSQARTWHEQIRALKGVYQKGAEAALGILETFSRHPIDQDKVMGLAQGIQSAEEWVGALDGGLEPLRSFHNHEIMDMDRVNYPELARLFAGKYARMIRVTDSFLGVLDRILQKEE
ncbi:MAG: hypothetical protein L7F78_00185 [Syntrophales bacterium LBB04]|nr:hypothetical protein [Syntrophales bacterium LBB04]